MYQKLLSDAQSIMLTLIPVKSLAEKLGETEGDIMDCLASVVREWNMLLLDHDCSLSQAHYCFCRITKSAQYAFLLLNVPTKAAIGPKLIKVPKSPTDATGKGPDTKRHADIDCVSPLTAKAAVSSLTAGPSLAINTN